MQRGISFEQLERSAAELAAATSPSDVFRRLLEGARIAAPRGSIFLLRQGRFKGWGCVGYTAAASSQLRQLSVPSDEDWLGRVAADPAARPAPLGPGEAAPRFGQPTAAEALGYPVGVGGRTVAVLVVERALAEEPWEPGAIAVLVTLARVRLDLDLAHRKLKTAAGLTLRSEAAGEPPPTEVPAAAPLAVDTSLLESAETTELEERAAAPVDDGDESPDAQRVRRYARLIATDIRLYNEEAVVLGRRNGDLARRLGDELHRGRQAFVRRYPDLGARGMRILHEAFVQVLAAGDARLLPGPERS